MRSLRPWWSPCAAPEKPAPGFCSALGSPCIVSHPSALVLGPGPRGRFSAQGLRPGVRSPPAFRHSAPRHRRRRHNGIHPVFESRHPISELSFLTPQQSPKRDGPTRSARGRTARRSCRSQRRAGEGVHGRHLSRKPVNEGLISWPLALNGDRAASGPADSLHARKAVPATGGSGQVRGDNPSSATDAARSFRSTSSRPTAVMPTADACHRPTAQPSDRRRRYSPGRRRRIGTKNMGRKHEALACCR